MHRMTRDERGLIQALLGDGRPLLGFTGLSLVLSGGFALFLAATGHFLPHDIQFLNMTATELCGINECRLVRFMFHDRVAFSGALMAIGSLYMWMASFPLRHGEAWAWWLFLLSGLVGFASFLAYLGYGYLDTWHGMATLLLLPCFIIGLARSFSILTRPRHSRSLLRPSTAVPCISAAGAGRTCLLATAAGMTFAGLTILTVGMTKVFVPQDLTFIGLSATDLHAINPRLVPLIAHDRAGFGGAISSAGIAMLFCVWCGTPSRSLWQILSLAGTLGFSTAIGIHFVIGYTDFVHLAPAVLGALLFLAGLILSFRPMVSQPELASPRGRPSKALQPPC